MINSTCVCLICNKKLTVLKAFNMERHSATHKEFFEKLPKSIEGLRLFYSEKLDAFKDLQHKMNITLNRQQIVTLASFKLVQAMIKKQLPFVHGEFLKSSIYLTMESLLVNHKDKIKILDDINGLQMSRRSVVRRLETLGNEIRSKLKKLLDKCLAFSVCFDESTDIVDNSQLIIWIRFVDDDLNCFEELIGLEVLLGTTKSCDIFAKVQECFIKMGINIENLVGVTTDGAPAMTGRINGVQSKIAAINPNVIGLKCIIHQENLCSKFGIDSAKPFSDFIMNVINKVLPYKKLYLNI